MPLGQDLAVNTLQDFKVLNVSVSSYVLCGMLPYYFSVVSTRGIIIYDNHNIKRSLFKLTKITELSISLYQLPSTSET